MYNHCGAASDEPGFFRTAHPLSVYRFVGGRTRLCLLLAESFGMTINTAMIFRTGIADVHKYLHQYRIQPFKMMVGDMVNEKQKGLCRLLHQVFSAILRAAGYLFPFILHGLASAIQQGVIPDSVIYSFSVNSHHLSSASSTLRSKMKMPPARICRVSRHHRRGT